MKFLVTGANGFVGHILCAELLRQGHAVRAAVRTKNAQVAGDKVIVGEINGETDWTDALYEVDVVIHLAARVHVMNDRVDDPLAEFAKVNIQGTKNLAQQAVNAGARRIVYVSSIKVNGERTTMTQPFTESGHADPQDPYGVSKWQAEQVLQGIAGENDIEAVIVRPTLVYGPRVKGNFIRLMHAINKGIPLPLSGACNARSLLYVGNLVDALITCATHPAAAGQTYLLSDGEDVSTAQLVAKTAKALERTDRSFYFPVGLLRVVATILGRSEQIDRLFGSLRVSDEKIRSELGWMPPYTLEQGLRKTADWYRHDMGAS
jgi:nucleoside-diphosphate-sugar epimerase